MNKQDIFYASLQTGIVFIAHALSGFLEQKVVNGEPFAWGWLFLWYTAFLFVGNILIKKWIIN